MRVAAVESFITDINSPQYTHILPEWLHMVIEMYQCIILDTCHMHLNVYLLEQLWPLQSSEG